MWTAFVQTFEQRVFKFEFERIWKSIWTIFDTTLSTTLQQLPLSTTMYGCHNWHQTHYLKKYWENFSEGQLHLILVVVVVRRCKHRQNQHLAVRQWQNKLQKSDFRGDNTVGSSSTPATSLKKNHVVAANIHRDIDFYMGRQKLLSKSTNGSATMITPAPEVGFARQ